MFDFNPMKKVSMLMWTPKINGEEYFYISKCHMEPNKKISEWLVQVMAGTWFETGVRLVGTALGADIGIIGTGLGAIGSGPIILLENL